MIVSTSFTDAAPIPQVADEDAPFGVYLHIPFCVHKCRYCDFVTYSGREALIPDYVAALQREIELAPRRWPGPLPRVTSVFWGGGTPSLLPPEAFNELHQRIADVFGWRGPRSEVEITVEANPETAATPYWSALRDAGVNRVSLGIQSFQAAGLRALDRSHDVATALAAIAAARAAGIDNLSVDLIYGWTGQEHAQWRADLAQVAKLQPEHVSLYALTVEERTPLAADIARGRVAAPDDDRQADFYLEAGESLSAAGYEQYELSNWARRSTAGARHRSRHNLLYWRNGEYLGVGVGAHSHLRGARFGNGRLVRRYIDQVRTGHHQPSIVEVISPATAMAETMILGLRLCHGVSREAFRARHGQSLDAVYGAPITALGHQGLLSSTETQVSLTARGRLLANEVFVHFVGT